MTIEHRTFRNVEVRAAGEGPNGRPVVELRAVTPGVVDDYGSLWNPATFDERMTARTTADPDDTPTLCWAHDWSDPIGHGVSYRSDEGGPMVGFELDDFEAVPRARQADAQVRSKTIRDCSVGFSHVERRDPTDDERSAYPGIKEVIDVADLDEVSLVLRGAVPGAKVLALRASPDGVDPDEDPVALAQAIDAVLDECQEAFAAGDMAAAGALLTAAEATVDALLAVFGVADEDDQDDAPDAPEMGAADAVLAALGLG